MNPGLHPSDQVKFVGAAMDLPHGKPSQTPYKQDSDKIESDQCRNPSARQGFCSASCGDIGIMFWSM